MRDLADLVAPLERGEFIEAYWDRQPLLARHNDKAAPGILSLADLDTILAQSTSWDTEVRLVREGQEFGIDTESFGHRRQALRSVHRAYEQGATVLVQFVHSRWEPLDELCRAVGRDLSAYVQANVFLSPPRTAGLDRHYDNHDVFVVQLEGSKHWRVFDQPVDRPMVGTPYDARPPRTPRRPLLEATLEPGDVLYLPRGFLHVASTADTYSLHVTLGARAVPAAALLVSAIEEAVARDRRLRAALPVDFATDRASRKDAARHLGALFAEVVQQIPWAHVLDELARAVQVNFGGELAGALVDLTHVGQIELDTVLRCRYPAWIAGPRDGRIGIAFSDTTVWLPERGVEEAVFLTEACRFAARDLPGDLDDAGRLVLVRRLVREGLLAVDT